MTERPTIAIFCNSFPPEVGGAPGRIYNLAVLLRDAGYTVQVVCAMPNYPTGRIFPAYRGRMVVNEVVDGIRVRRVWMIPSNASSAWQRGSSLVSFVVSLRMFAYPFVLKQQPALVIVSSPPLPMAADVGRFFRRRGIKVLLNVSDIWPLSAAALGMAPQNRLYRLLQKTERTLYRRAVAFTGQSREILEHIRQTSGEPKPAMLYRNLPADVVADAASDLPPPGPVCIIYPGLLGHAQGVLALCKTVNFRALGATLHIYGNGAEEPAIRAWIDATPECGVQVYQPVSAAALSGLLSRYHAMIIPLVAPIEGAVPSKLFTAIQAGLPVLYSGSGEGEALVVEHGLGWTAPPGDFRAVEANIRKLQSLSAEAWASMRHRIRQTGAAAFSKLEQEQAMLRFISETIAT